MFSRVEYKSKEERVLLLKCCCLTVVLAVLDQFTKYLVMQNMKFMESIPVIPGFFNLTYITNPGAAWGILSNRGILLLTISMIVVLLILVFYKELCCFWSERYYSLGLVFSGILGNTYDRIFRSTEGGICNGQVVDFLDFYIGSSHWPCFNVADSCICLGCFIFVLSNFIRPEDKDKSSRQNDSKHKTV